MMHQTRWEVESRSISIYYIIHYSDYDRLTLISDALFASMELCINLASMKGLYIAVPSSCSMRVFSHDMQRIAEMPCSLRVPRR